MIPSCLFAVNQEEMQFFEVEPVGVMEEAGGPMRLRHTVSGSSSQYQHVFDLLFSGVFQLWSPVPNAHGKIINYTGVDPEFGLGTTFLPVL